ncbi:MAG: acyl-CoA reductase [Gemmatimonadota bacterium]
MARAVRNAALRAREARSTASVVDRASRAALRLADPRDPIGREALSLLGRELGWSASLCASTLEGMSASWTREALTGVLDEELGGAAALDGFVRTSRAGRRRRALGPPLLLLVHAGNVPGVTITAMIRGLMVRSGVLCKLPREEPGLGVLFARALSAEDRLLGDCVAAAWWAGAARGEPWGEWVKLAGKVIVYGGEDVVRAVREDARVGADVVAYGPRVGIAVLLPDADRPEAAARLAKDVLAYAQQGCVSPRAAYVVGGSAGEFAETLATALGAACETAPERPLAAEATAIRALRAEVEFEESAGSAGEGSPGGRAVLGSADGYSWTVITGERPEPPVDDLPRVVRVHPVPDVSTLRGLLDSLEGRIQAIGTAGREGWDEVVALGLELGVSRVAELGTMAWPPPDWRHDGRAQLLPLIRWMDVED